MNVALVITTLNEIDGVRVILPQIDFSEFTKVLVLDGNSTDGTIEYCQNLNLEVLIQSKSGFRHGMYEMYSRLLTEEIDYIITFSPDGNCDPSTLQDFVLACDGSADLIIGSRYKGDTKSEDDDLITAFGNIFFTQLTNLLFRAKFTDVFSIYRGFKPDLITKLSLMDEKSFAPMEKFFQSRLGWEPLMSFRAARMKLVINEVAVGEPARIGGERKLQIFRWGGSFLMQLVREVWYRPENRNLKRDAYQ
jgi:glycosyltransferase involved in cell wall biosynthesis